MKNMTDVVNNVANALRETGAAFIDADLYHAVMDTLGFSEEALIVAFSHLLDNKAHATVYVNMVDSHRVL
jgi:spore maturation protein SpmB